MKRLAVVLISTSMLVGPQFGFANSVDQRLLVGALSPTCSFANPVTGDASYDEPQNLFATNAGKESKIDVTFRSMSALYIDNDNTINEDGVNIGAQIDDIDYTGSAVSGDITAALGNYTGTGYNDASFISLSNLPEGTITTTLDTVLQMVAGFTPSQTAAYRTTYILTCVQ